MASTRTASALALALGLWSRTGWAEEGTWNRPAIHQAEALARFDQLPRLGPPIVVAVLDTGVNPNEQALQPYLEPGYNALSGEPVWGTDPTALQYHGTHVAGIIVQINPRCRILPVRVMNALGDGAVEVAARGILWALGRPIDGAPPPRRPAQVINLSLTTPGYSPVLEQAIVEALRAGVIVVAAAGNQERYAASYSPGGLPEVITVGAATPTPDLPRWPASNFGDRVTLLAPGEGISSLPGPHLRDGTSQAAPHVSAALAMAKALVPALQQRSLARLLRQSAQPSYRCPQAPGGCGAGLLDVAALVALTERQVGSACPGDRLAEGLECVDPGPVAADSLAPLEGGCSVGRGSPSVPWGFGIVACLFLRRKRRDIRP